MLENKGRALVIFILLFLALIPVFWLNALGTAPTDFFESWQKDSESLVLGKIESERVDRPVDSFGLAYARPDKMGAYATVDRPDNDIAGLTASKYEAYRPQLGLAGYFYSTIYEHTPCSSLNCLHLASSTLFSFMLASLTFLLGITTRRSFAIVFLMSVVASPWLVTSARNLYWSPWMWLLPACAAALFVVTRKPTWRAASLALLFFAFTIKFASGYEFLTSLSLMAVAIPILGWTLQRKKVVGAGLRAAKDAFAIFAVSLAAFATVVSVHAFVRGSGSIWAGLGAIWREDVLRRTYGSAEQFPAVYADSLNVSPIVVLGRYVFGWKTDFVSLGHGAFTLGSNSLWILLLVATGIVITRGVTGDRLWKRDIALLATTAAIPLSWFILAKAHSSIHGHINFVLWYLFFTAALLFVVCDFLATRVAAMKSHTLPQPTLNLDKSRSETSPMRLGHRVRDVAGRSLTRLRTKDRELEDSRSPSE